MDAALLTAQIVATGLIAAWLTTGVYDNIRHPRINETYTAEVFSMARMKSEYPVEYAEVAHRAVHNRTVQLIAFRIVILAELVACLLLWSGVIGLLMAATGTGSLETGRTFALLGAAAFTCVWGGFLIVGNYFSYWFCHEGAQNTHYQMTLWGLGTMILIAAA
jgi:predicted small integral membrane protein